MLNIDNNIKKYSFTLLNFPASRTKKGLDCFAHWERVGVRPN